jgi:hypothetical protein
MDDSFLLYILYSPHPSPPDFYSSSSPFLLISPLLFSSFSPFYSLIHIFSFSSSSPVSSLLLLLFFCVTLFYCYFSLHLTPLFFCFLLSSTPSYSSPPYVTGSGTAVCEDFVILQP